MGKIGLAISPQNPDVVYAAIELDRRDGRRLALGRPRRRPGRSAPTPSPAAPGPHYYQELFASPHAFDRIYLMDVRIQVSDDGGTTFRRMTEKHKHSDNHALAFHPDDPDYLLVGTDGGLYESFDLAKTWRFVANLPVTQFYKVAVDDDEPFYNIYGGTQDNTTQGGPSRTDNVHGIRNADWFITLCADGHQPAIEPGNPDIVYSEWQQGNLVRVDRTTGEIVYIQPQPEPGEPPERFNWDAPILVSPHAPTRLYYASQRVWRQRRPRRQLAPDLRRPDPRPGPPAAADDGPVWSCDAPWDLVAMSNYGTITSLAESPAGRGAALRRHRRRPDPGHRGRRRAGAASRSARCRASRRPPSSTTSRPTCTTPTPSTSRSTTTRSATSRPTCSRAPTAAAPGARSPATCRPAPRVAGRAGPRQARPAVRRHRVRDLLHRRRRRPLDQADRRRADHLVPRPRHPAARERPGGRVLRPRLLRARRLLAAAGDRRDRPRARRPCCSRPRRAWWYIERRPLGGSGRAPRATAFFIAPNPPFGAVFTYYLAKGLKTPGASSARRRRRR